VKVDCCGIFKSWFTTFRGLIREEGIVPKDWRSGVVIPLRKMGDKINLDTYEFLYCSLADKEKNFKEC
jgi:hypothetical protein